MAGAALLAKGAPAEITNTYDRDQGRAVGAKAAEVELPAGMLDIMAKLQQGKGEVAQLEEMQRELLRMRAEIVARAEAGQAQ